MIKKKTSHEGHEKTRRKDKDYYSRFIRTSCLFVSFVASLALFYFQPGSFVPQSGQNFGLPSIVILQPGHCCFVAVGVPHSGQNFAEPTAAPQDAHADFAWTWALALISTLDV